MLNELQPKPWSGGNCFHVTMSNLLEFKGYPNHRTVWKQCGICYLKRAESPVGELLGTYLSKQQEVHWINGVQLHEVEQTNPQLLIREVQQLLDAEEPVIIYVDPYHLPHSMDYQNRHSIHCFTLTGYSADAFQFVDDILNCKGEIAYEDLIQANDSRYGWPVEHRIPRGYLYLGLDEANIPQPKDYWQVFRKNYLMMLGDPAEHARLITEYDLEPGSLIVGLAAISAFAADCRALLEREDELFKQLFNNFYKALFDVSHQHSLFAGFLREGIASFPNLAELVEECSYLAQEWKVAGNMIVKGMLKNHRQMFVRMIEKVDTIRVHEQEWLERAGHFLERQQSGDLL